MNFVDEILNSSALSKCIAALRIFVELYKHYKPINVSIRMFSRISKKKKKIDCSYLVITHESSKMRNEENYFQD